jgi:hypothetical protein
VTGCYDDKNQNIQYCFGRKSVKLSNQKEYLYQVLGGASYTIEERPPLWQNDAPLLPLSYRAANPPDMELLPLAEFPLIPDFEIWLTCFLDSGQAPFGYHVSFFSPSHGFIASFPWWDYAENTLIMKDFEIPIGDFDFPFSDLEQGWEIVIAKKDGLVYVMQGQLGQRKFDGYSAWFKVLQQDYFSQWHKAIELCKKLKESAQ